MNKNKNLQQSNLAIVYDNYIIAFIINFLYAKEKNTKTLVFAFCKFTQFS